MRKTFAAFAIATLPLLSAAPALAQAAPAVAAADTAGASAFVQDLVNRTFSVLRDRSLPRAQAKDRFRQMLRDNFAVTEIGNRLIARHRAKITPQQLQAYQTALPTFIVNTYADRLFDYADATVKVTRATPRGSRGDVDVASRITEPGNNRPIDAIWAVRPVAGGKFQITNLTVNGVNVALTQAADFDAYIQRNGFDALVTFMRNAKPAA